MKTFKTIMALTALCSGLVSCSKDAGSSAQGERLPEGRYPIEFTAEGVAIEPFTRATVDGDWDGVQSVAVAIYTRSDNVKRYSVTSDDGGKTAKFTSDDPFWWEFSGEIQSVIAWYPYSDSYPSNWLVKADQSAVENYRASDLVMGRNADISFAEKNDPSKNRIVFQHETSKVVVNLVSGPGVTLDGNTSVKFLNVSGVETGNTVTAYRPDAAKQSFCALLSYQKIAAGTPFIQVDAAGGTFVYTPSAERQLNPNVSYSYTITVKAAGIEVKEAMGGEWTDGGSEDVSSTMVYKASDLKVGDYYYSDGTISDGGLRKEFPDGTMEWTETPQTPVSGKTVIGIVFYAGHHPNDNSDYSQSGIGKKNCRGYAVALQNAVPGGCPWGEYFAGVDIGCYPRNSDGSPRNNYDGDNWAYDWSGYKYTGLIIDVVGGKENLNGTAAKFYPATYYTVVAYEDKVHAPANSSGWFFPSVGQMCHIRKNNASLFDGRGVTADLLVDWYWSSSEYWDRPRECAVAVIVGYDNSVFSVTKDSYTPVYGEYYVRSVLAF